MKIQIESHGNTYTFENESNDLQSIDVVETIINLLVCIGYSRENIIEIMNQYEI